jgi:uncharacterized protein
MKVIDACVFHEWASAQTLAPYLSSGWRDVVLRPGDKGGALNIKSGWAFESPGGRKAFSAYPEKGLPGSDFDLLVKQVLGHGKRERVVLGYDDGLLATAYPLPYVARQVVRAANDWTLENWLARDERLYGMVLVIAGMPEEAAKEIRRSGRDPRMVAVALGTNGLGRQFGHPAYHPIYEAAAELDLPIVIQAGSDSATDLTVDPLAGGPPATYSEYDTFASHPLAAHTTSLILGGAFDLYPNLKVLLVGGGVAWVPGFVWRMDGHYRMTRNEAPWLRMLPSEYFAQHFKVATASLESPPKRERLAQVLKSIPAVERTLVYASCYPNDDFEEPETIAARLPEAWHAGVFGENAREFFRWPDRTPAQIPAGVRRETIEDRLPARAESGS